MVERHQTLYRICKTYGVDINRVASLNGIPDHGKIDVGQRIFIPGATKVLKVEIYIDDVVEESEEKGKEKIVYPKSDFIWPVLGSRTAGFDDSERNRHQGIDIACPLGTPIKASGSGVVVYSGNTIKGYGNLIILRHPGSGSRSTRTTRSIWWKRERVWRKDRSLRRSARREGRPDLISTSKSGETTRS